MLVAKTTFIEDRAQVYRMSLGTGQDNKFNDIICPSYVHNLQLVLSFLLFRYVTVQLMCDQNAERDFQASENAESGSGSAYYVCYNLVALSVNSC